MQITIPEVQLDEEDVFELFKIPRIKMFLLVLSSFFLGVMPSQFTRNEMLRRIPKVTNIFNLFIKLSPEDFL